MLYRRKVLLALVEALGREVTTTDLQHLLFLLSTIQEQPSYHFIPNHYGCYSFTLDADRRSLAKHGLVMDHDKWVLASSERYLPALRPPDRTAIDTVVRQFKGISNRELVRHVYLNHPYYAINSEFLHEVLNPEERQKVDSIRPQTDSPHLFTLGYQGLSLEQYLNKLIENSVFVLCDVRRNALSMKYGFSKKTLEKACDGVGVDYVHLPELGIDSSQRKQLDSQADYDSLFRDYRKTTLPENQEALESITSLIGDHGIVALTCFEADPAQCHRSCVADALFSNPAFGYPVSHL